MLSVLRIYQRTFVFVLIMFIIGGEVLEVAQQGRFLNNPDSGLSSYK